jgi:hypothetical protein
MFFEELWCHNYRDKLVYLLLVYFVLKYHFLVQEIIKSTSLTSFPLVGFSKGYLPKTL